MAQSGINKVILLGNLGQDPEVRYTAGGVPIANVSIATSNSWKDKTLERLLNKQNGTELFFLIALQKSLSNILKKVQKYM